MLEFPLIHDLHINTLFINTAVTEESQLGLRKPMSYLQLVKGRYRVRMVVPAALRPIIGTGSLVKALGTGDRAQADHLAIPHVAQFNARLKAAAAKIANVGMPRYWVTPPDLLRTAR
jgi:hypothetical protein